MSEHQIGAGGAPERGSGMGSGLDGSSPDAPVKGQGSAYVHGQGRVPPDGQRAESVGQGGHGEPTWPPLGQGSFMNAGVEAVPPWQAPYPPPAPAGVPYQGYYSAAPHAWVPPYMAPPYAAPYAAYAGYPPPPPGAYPPPDAFQAMHQGHAHGAAQGAGQAQGARMSDLMEEVASGGNGLSTLSKMLNFDDPDFWKGALVGAAAVLLLTSDSVQQALFGSGANGNGSGGKESGT